MSLFCRHNRYLADCPICSKGTALEAGRAEGRRPRPRSGGARRGKGDAGPEPAFTGPYAAAGPYDDDAYEVRLERVPGGLRLAEWQAGQIRRRAPVLAASDLPGLLEAAAERGVEGADELAGALGGEESVGEGEAGVSPGRAGELREELRVERVDPDRLRVGRWILRPNAGWELQEAPVMLPPARYAEALAGAASRGLLTS